MNSRPVILTNPTAHFSILPVLSKLQERQKYNLLTFNALDQFHTPDIDRFVINTLNYLGPKIQNGFDNLNLEKYLGVHAQNLTSQVREILAKTINETLPLEVLLIELFKRCVSLVDLKLILLWEDVMIDSKTIALTARKFGIPSLHIVHGYIAGHPGSIDSDVHDRNYTSKVAVYGEKGKQYYVKHGNPQEDIVITGNPAWDAYYNLKKNFDRANFLKTIGLDPQKPTVLYASTSARGWGSFEKDFVENRYRLLLRAIHDIQAEKQVQLIVKPHPTNHHKVNEYRLMAEESGVTNFKILTTNKEEALASSDLVICNQSNIGIEAILLDKPTITLEFQYDRVEETFYEEQDAIVRIFEPGDLLPVMKELLFGQDMKKALDVKLPSTIFRYNYLNDGQAAERVIDLIDTMTGMNR